MTQLPICEPGSCHYYYFQRDSNIDQGAIAWQFFYDLTNHYQLQLRKQTELTNLPPAEEHNGFDIVLLAQDQAGDTYAVLIHIHDVLLLQLFLNVPISHPPTYGISFCQKALSEQKQQHQNNSPASLLTQSEVYCVINEGQALIPKQVIKEIFPGSPKEIRITQMKCGTLVQNPTNNHYLLVAPREKEKEANIFLSELLPMQVLFAYKMKLELEEYDKLLEIVEKYHRNLPLLEDLRRSFYANQQNYRLLFPKIQSSKDKIFKRELSDLHQKIHTKNKRMKQNLAQTPNSDSPIEGAIRDTYPFPLAHAYLTLERSPTCQARFQNIINLTNLSFEYIALLLTACYLNQPRRIEAVEQFRQQTWQRANLGDWGTLVEKIANSLNQEELFIPEFAGFYKGEIPPLMEELSSFRNNYHGHGASFQEESEYEELLKQHEPIIKEFLQKLHFLSDYPLTYAAIVSPVRRHKKIRCQWNIAQGAYEIFVKRQETLELKEENEILQSEEMFLRHKNENQWLPLYPFIIMDPCPKCQRGLSAGEKELSREVFLYSKVNKGKAIYQSYKTGHKLERKWDGQEFGL